MEYAALYLSHGSPMMVLDDTPTRAFLQDLGKRLAKPKAVVAVSAHWLTQVPAVGCAAWPEKINDIYGFPPALFQMRYDAPGDPGLGNRVADLLGDPVRRDPGAGIDHGIWSVMSLIWPEADVPVVPVSVQPEAGAAFHYALGRKLRPLAEDGILVIGTGAATHGLEDYYRRPVGAPVEPHVQAFTDWLATVTEAGLTESLLRYRQLAPEAERNHPTEEHLLPFFAALGAAPQGTGQRIHHDVDSGVLAMDAYGFH